MERRTRRQSVWALALLLAIPLRALAADPLPSWNDGPVKQSILNDGTLWQEQPVVQGAFLLELLQYLRANGFQTWTSSGGGMDFMRVVSEDTYGIPPQQVIGGGLKERFDEDHGHPVLRREARVDPLNDKAGKPVGIEQHIGRRPVFAAGNVRSGGDIQTLQYTQEQPRPGFALLIHHDDAEREGGWTVVSMRQDWRRIFPQEGP